jgi:3-oxoacyl-[acyl-carrier-protein] synthase-3
MMRTRILGTGFVTGEHLITNEALTQVMETSDRWIRERSGVEERYYVEDGTTTTDLGAGAARKAIADAGIDAKQIDYIVFATMTPDHFFPGCGALLQSELQLGNVPALDIRQQCTGFIYGLQVSDALIRSGEARTVLLVGAEVHSGFMPFDNWDLLFGRGGHGPTPEQKEWNTKFRDRTVLFGDAAGACVLAGAEGERGLLGFEVRSDGNAFQDLYVPSCGFAQRPYVTKKDIDEGRHIPEMNGKQVFKMAVTRMPQVVHAVCDRLGVSLKDIDLLIAHQANLRINEAVQRALELPDSKVFNNIQRYGNTTAATIPIAFDEARRAGRVKDGDLVCFVGLGAGFHWGAALMRA